MSINKSIILLALVICCYIAFAADSAEHSEDSTKKYVAQYQHKPVTCLPRQKAPFFSATAVKDEKFTRISLDDFKGKYLVLLFYPFDFTYVCPTELVSFSDNISRFREMNADVIGEAFFMNFLLRRIYKFKS